MRPAKRTSSEADLPDESPTKRFSSVPLPGSHPSSNAKLSLKDYLITAHDLIFKIFEEKIVFIFLKVDWNKGPNRGKAYYHVAYPGRDVEQSSSASSAYQLTAVGQLLAFTLIAAGKPGTDMSHDQTQRNKLMANLQRWDPREPQTPSAWESEAHSADESRDSSDNESSSQGPAQGTRSKTSAQRTGQQTQGGRSRNNAIFGSLGGPGSEHRGANEGDIPYCTQKCLAGVVSGAALDENCPNVVLHRGNTKRAYGYHRLNRTQFIEHLSNQLKWSLDRGVATRIQHLARYLVREAAVYERLRPIQGKHVPIYLGSVDLRSIGRTYYYPFGISVIYMIFLAWGGTAANRADLDEQGMNTVEKKAKKSLRACRSLGVTHGDVRLANMVISEANEVMMIDFDRAKLVEPRRKTVVDKPDCQPQV
ncbi:hypothetical protein CP532_6628 [Ophiocordyceps camponoti-leonardi (nom. inval.)]|nr:hypothetical protein CP532_6628 [Ophiocordyceps camponoti-leonardi (nom. inval.)]